jgi:hypothetical protein
MFASALSKHIVSEVVLHNNFNSTGARQFDFDMSTLVKMFSQYTSKPDNFLKEYVKRNTYTLQPTNACCCFFEVTARELRVFARWCMQIPNRHDIEG